MVGLLPLCAVTVVEADVLTRFPWLTEAARRFLRQHAELVLNIASPTAQGVSGRRLLSPHCLLFYEYFHGDNGAGIGASHQTGWTGSVAFLLHYFGRMHSGDVLAASNLLAPRSEVV